MNSIITLSEQDLYMLLRKVYPKLDITTALPQGVAVIHLSRRTVYCLTKTDMFSNYVSAIASVYPQESGWDIEENPLILPDKLNDALGDAITLQRMAAIGRDAYTVAVIGQYGVGFLHFTTLAGITRAGHHAIDDLSEDDAAFAVKAIFSRYWRSGVVEQRAKGPLQNPDKQHRLHEAKTRFVVFRNQPFTFRVAINHSNGR